MAESDFRYPVALAPLDYSHRDNQFEADLYQMFMDLYEDYLRVDERDLNVSAVPHLGSFDLVSRNVEMDGLALINNDDEPAMRYLHKAWNHRNPKRGLEFLETYLQLLFPNGWKVKQLWHPISSADQYPDNVEDSKDKISGDAFLTSRIRVSLSGGLGDDEYLNRVTPALRSILPARLLLETRGYILKTSDLPLASLISTSGDYQKKLSVTGSHSSINTQRIKVAGLLNMSACHLKTVSPEGVKAIDVKSELSIPSMTSSTGNTILSVTPVSL